MYIRYNKPKGEVRSELSVVDGREKSHTRIAQW